ncbi:prolyl oligopeptidase family serine peptidase [Pseudonocardia sp. GCM10023141]|uniref:S9 family peptidase n=1 Tax=Pseudonocardia sp. GCM10023141 TaxID=3252653 RepID=UPI003611A99E
MSSDVSWREHFATPIRCGTFRCAGAVDAELVLSIGAKAQEVAVWDPATGTLVDVPNLPHSLEGPVLSADARSVLVLNDPTGTEIGHLWSFPLDGSPATDLTPDMAPYTMRGVDVARDGSAVVINPANSDGFALWIIRDGVRCLYRSDHEAWNSLVAADAALASIDTTDHNPGIRRFAVTVVDTASGAVVGVLSDGPLAPVRGVRFSPVAGDPRMLVSTERTGFARPAVWNPLTGERVDVDAPELAGELVPLDWSDDGGRLLLVHVDRGIHRVHEYDLGSGALTRVEHPDGAYFEPDVAAVPSNIWASHYGPGGEIRLLRQRTDLPLEVLAPGGDGRRSLLAPENVVPGVALRSEEVVSRDGTRLQLWVARPPGTTGPVPMILHLHGGPNLCFVDRYHPAAQAWLAEGFGFASLNYRGSVTFGREFREGFWGAVGDRELEDVEAAWQWLVEGGIAEPTQTFITGSSYGGFLTLLSLGRLPELFAGGLAFIAMADWERAYDDMNPALQAAWRGFIGGSPETAIEKFRYSSPLTYVENVRAPVLLSQGIHDTRTPPEQAAEYARRLTAAGGDALLDWFDGGHGASSTERMADMLDVELDLVRKALRGERWSPA